MRPDTPRSLLEASPQPLLDWARAELDARGHRLHEVVDVRRRHWSVVAQLSTSTGTVWAKANARGFVHEAAVLALLGEVAPERVLAPLALDTGSGWLLLPDGGPTLHDGGAGGTAAWEPLLDSYARLQRATEPHVDRLVAAGVPDRRPGALVDLVEGVAPLADEEPVARELGEIDGRAVRATGAAVARWAQTLASGSVPLSLEHNDVHPGNVFVRDGLRIFDWGDAVVTHPFVGLLTLRSLVADGQAAAALRDRYLAHWLDLAPLPDLRSLADVATCVAHLLRAATWTRVPAEARATYPQYVAEHLRDLVVACQDAAGEEPTWSSRR